MLLQLIFLPAVLVAAKLPRTSAPANKTGKGTPAPLSISDDRDPFGVGPFMVKMMSNIPSSNFRFEPRVQKPAKNVPLPVVSQNDTPMPMNMFPSLLGDMMLHSVFDAVDDIASNERAAFLPIDILDTNPDLPGSKPVVQADTPRPGSIRITSYKPNTLKFSHRASPAAGANQTDGNATAEKAGSKTGNKTDSKQTRVKRSKLHTFSDLELFPALDDLFFKDVNPDSSDVKISVPESSSVNFSEEPTLKIRTYHNIYDPFLRFGSPDSNELMNPNSDSFSKEPALKIRAFRNIYDPIFRDDNPDPSGLKVSIPDPNSANFSEQPALKIQTFRISSFRDMSPSIFFLRLAFKTGSNLTSKLGEGEELADNSTKSVFCRIGTLEFSIYKCSAFVYILFTASVLVSGCIILHTKKSESQRKGSVIRI